MITGTFEQGCQSSSLMKKERGHASNFELFNIEKYNFVTLSKSSAWKGFYEGAHLTYLWQISSILRKSTPWCVFWPAFGCLRIQKLIEIIFQHFQHFCLQRQKRKKIVVNWESTTYLFVYGNACVSVHRYHGSQKISIFSLKKFPQKDLSFSMTVKPLNMLLVYNTSTWKLIEVDNAHPLLNNYKLLSIF